MGPYEHSPETIAKISASAMGRKRSPEARARISAANKGRKHLPEARAKMSASRSRNKSELSAVVSDLDTLISKLQGLATLGQVKSQNMELSAQTQQRLLDLAQSIAAINDGMLRAGEIMVDILDNHGFTLAGLHEKLGLSVEVLSQFERVGRHQMHHKLLNVSYAAVSFLKRLPYSEQDRCIEQGVELLVLKNGEPDVMMQPVTALSRKQCKQVFTKDSVRDLGAQRAFLADATPIPLPVIDPWRVKNGEILIAAPCSLERSMDIFRPNWFAPHRHRIGGGVPSSYYLP